MSEQQEFRHELEATLAAREEMGAGLEPQLVERFADEIEQEIARRAKEQAYRQRPRSRGHAPTIPPALGSPGLAIPLIGAAGGLAGGAGGIAVCIAIVLVNLLWVFGRD